MKEKLSNERRISRSHLHTSNKNSKKDNRRLEGEIIQRLKRVC